MTTESKPYRPRKTHWRFNVTPEVCPHHREGQEFHLTAIRVMVRAELEPNEHLATRPWDEGEIIFDQPEDGVGNAVARCHVCDRLVPVVLTHRGGPLDGQPYQPTSLLFPRGVKPWVPA